MAQTRKRLAGPSQLPTSAGTAYTAPSATTTKISHITFTNPSGSAVTVTVSIGSDAAGTRVMPAISVPANSVYSSFVEWYVAAAEIVQWTTGTATTCVGMLNGTEYSAG